MQSVRETLTYERVCLLLDAETAAREATASACGEEREVIRSTAGADAIPDPEPGPVVLADFKRRSVKGSGCSDPDPDYPAAA